MSIVNKSHTCSNDTQSSALSSHHIPDHEGAIHFDPPLYRQRYMFALDVIHRDPTLHSLLDIGCGPCQLLTIGKYRNPHVQLMAAIDIVRYQLDEACFRLKPLPVEYMISRRETPLQMYVLHGDATKKCNCFHDFDVVTLIEVIEHLYTADLENLVEHVFSNIEPRLVIVSTPNADFNVLFPTMTYGRFRHTDHKFEFTRQQFHTWGHAISHKYNYLVEYHGVGHAPSEEQHKNVGACTQIAIFHRQHRDIHSKLTSNDFSKRLSSCNQHEIVGFIDYPFTNEKSNELHEQVRYILEMYRIMAEDKARRGDDHHNILPLTIGCQNLMNHPRLLQYKLTIEEIKQIVQYLDYKLLDQDQIVLSEETLVGSSDDYVEGQTEQDLMEHKTQATVTYRQFNPNEESWD